MLLSYEFHFFFLNDVPKGDFVDRHYLVLYMVAVVRPDIFLLCLVYWQAQRLLLEVETPKP